jgi:hypothetical protein
VRQAAVASRKNEDTHAVPGRPLHDAVKRDGCQFGRSRLADFIVNLQERAMLKVIIITSALGISLAAPVAEGADLMKAPPGGGYKKASELVKLPDFVPGLGQLYVKLGSLPAGPFLAYDKKGKLVSSIYMIPIKDIDDHKNFDDLATGPKKVDHVDLYFNAGHPGVEVPHYHFILWYIPEKEADMLK